MKKIIFIIVLSCSLSSCISIERCTVNEQGNIWDVSEHIIIPDSMFTTKVFYNTGIKDYDTISGNVFVEFKLSFNGFDVYPYLFISRSDTLYTRFKYSFSFPTPVLPLIKLNSFSFTDKNSNIIPGILYYRTYNPDNAHLKKIMDSLRRIRIEIESQGRTIRKIIDSLSYIYNEPIINIIDNLPSIFTNNNRHRTFEIIVECSQSYRKTKLIYVNYDIEVGNKRYVKQIKYQRKLCFNFGHKNK